MTKLQGWLMLAAIIVVGIIGLVIISQLTAAAEQHKHELRVSSCEEDLADPYGADFETLLACVDHLTERG